MNKVFKPFFLIILIALELSACTVSKQTTYHIFQPKDPHQVRIASYNINWGEPDWKENNRTHTLEAIKVVNADIIFLQEVGPDWRIQLNEYFANQYRYRRYCPYAKDALHRGLAILSKYPIHSKKIIDSISGWYPAWQVYISTPVGKIQFLGVRLIPIHYDAYDLSSLPPYPIFTSSLKRRKDFIGYYLQLDPYTPTVILGDFNETDDGLTVNFLRRQGYVDAYSLLKKPTYTWHWPFKFVTLASHLDYIFYTPTHLHAVRAQVLHEGDSDHFPLVADFVR